MITLFIMSSVNLRTSLGRAHLIVNQYFILTIYFVEVPSGEGELPISLFVLSTLVPGVGSSFISPALVLTGVCSWPGVGVGVLRLVFSITVSPEPSSSIYIGVLA